VAFARLFVQLFAHLGKCARIDAKKRQNARLCGACLRGFARVRAPWMIMMMVLVKGDRD